MTSCQCKAGFFALRDCENMALGQCAVCARFICALHTAPDSVMTTCRDCRARQAQEEPGATGEGETRYDDRWAYSYRDRYYGSGYTPPYAGSHSRRHYDNQDAQSFAQREGEFDDDDDPQAGFGDS
jgi:hypothetical protein